jgi:hypothetical protein
MKTLFITFFNIKGTVHSKFIPQGGTVNRANYMEIMKRLREAMLTKRPELSPTIGFSTMTMLQLTRRFLSSSFWPKNREMEQPPYFPDVFERLLFPKIKSASQIRRFQGPEDIQTQKSDNTERFSITGVPKMFPTVTGSIIRLDS